MVSERLLGYVALRRRYAEARVSRRKGGREHLSRKGEKGETRHYHCVCIIHFDYKPSAISQALCSPTHAL